MKVYQVGGAVRDRLLGRPIADRDWVVTGGTAEELEALGFKCVGHDFPVFLHPDTHEEYALARAERKTGPGYRGFVFDTSPTVTLEEDLRRRDLTINAMAEDEAGQLIDPFNGKTDLDAGILRHVSPAFAEDPVRILRVARFAARYGFQVAPETLALIDQIAASGEASALVPERVWTELERALGEPYPRRFVEVLRDGGALHAILPELAPIFAGSRTPEHGADDDIGVHTLEVLEQAASLSTAPEVRFAALVHNLENPKTACNLAGEESDATIKPVRSVTKLCTRLRAPKKYRALGELVARFHSLSHNVLALPPDVIYQLIVSTDALRRPERFEQFLLCCIADARACLGHDHSYSQAGFLREVVSTIRVASTQAMAAKVHQPADQKQYLEHIRIAVIATVLDRYKTRASDEGSNIV